MTINDKIYRELRCASCHKLICFEYIFAGRIAFTCHRCGELNERSFKHINSKENSDIIKEEFEVQTQEPKGGE